MTDDIVGDLYFFSYGGGVWSSVIETRAHVHISKRNLSVPTPSRFTSIFFSFSLCRDDVVFDSCISFCTRRRHQIDGEPFQLGFVAGSGRHSYPLIAFTVICMHVITSHSKLTSSHKSATHAKYRLFLSNWFSLRAHPFIHLPYFFRLTLALLQTQLLLLRLSVCINNLCDKLISLYISPRYARHTTHTSSTDWEIRFSFINIMLRLPYPSTVENKLEWKPLTCVRYEWHMHDAYLFFTRIIMPLFFTMSTRITRMERNERFRLIENYYCFDWASSALTTEIICCARIDCRVKIESNWKCIFTVKIMI